MLSNVKEVLTLNKKLIAILITAIIVIALIAGGIYCINKDKSNENTAEEEFSLPTSSEIADNIPWMTEDDVNKVMEENPLTPELKEIIDSYAESDTPAEVDHFVEYASEENNYTSTYVGTDGVTYEISMPEEYVDSTKEESDARWEEFQSMMENTLANSENTESLPLEENPNYYWDEDEQAWFDKDNPLITGEVQESYDILPNDPEAGANYTEEAIGSNDISLEDWLNADPLPDVEVNPNIKLNG